MHCRLRGPWSTLMQQAATLPGSPAEHHCCPGRRKGALRTFAAKELHFNRSGETLKRMQAGVDKLASVVGVTLGPKVRPARV